MQRYNENVSVNLEIAYKRRDAINEEIETLEKEEAKKYYEFMNKEADNTMHGVANTEVCKEFSFYYDYYVNSPSATLERMKLGMMQHLLAYQIFDKIPYEKWDKYCAAIYEQCDMILDYSIGEDEFEGNRRDIIDEATE